MIAGELDCLRIIGLFQAAVDDASAMQPSVEAIELCAHAKRGSSSLK